MKKLILFLFLSTSLFCFGQGKSALKDIQSIKFYGVDYSQAKVFGADESPIHSKMLSDVSMSCSSQKQKSIT